MLNDLIPAFVTLFVIIDPIGLVPIFIALTAQASTAHRRKMAIHGCAIGFAILMLFALIGDKLLAAMGITLPAFRLAGGILLFLIALEMVFEQRTKRRNQRAEEMQSEGEQHDAATADAADAEPVNEDIAAFPIAIPFIAGPGAIATVILLMGKANTDWKWQAGIIGATALTVFITWILFMASASLAHRLPPALINVITRILGILLAALSIQLIIDGVQQAFHLSEL